MNDDYFQQYVEQIARYYRPERLQAVLAMPAPVFDGLSRMQMIQAGFGDVMVRVTHAGMTWQPERDLASLGLTPEMLAEAHLRLAKGGDADNDGNPARVTEKPGLSDDSDPGSRSASGEGE